MAANDRRFRQTPFRLQCHPRVPLQRRGTDDAQADHVGSVARNKMFIMQNAQPLSCELLTHYLLNSLDGPDTLQMSLSTRVFDDECLVAARPFRFSGVN